MKTSMSWQGQQTLGSSAQSRRQEGFGLRAQLNHIWQSILASVTVSSEPHIWTEQNRAGQVRWHGHDPITGETIEVGSEDAMRVWLEERHYH